MTADFELTMHKRECGEKNMYFAPTNPPANFDQNYRFVQDVLANDAVNIPG